MTLFLSHQKLPLSIEDEAKGFAGWARLVRESCLNMCRRGNDSPIRYFPHRRGSSGRLGRTTLASLLLTTYAYPTIGSMVASVFLPLGS
jgi:hypothetical protein